MKPLIPKGTRDFLPQQVQRRNYIFDTVRKTFVKYGYAPIETPAMEDLRTLSGKYGEEGDQLLFKVLNNGDYLKKADKVALEAMDSSKLVSSISKRGLRYDLTIPFARYVVMYQNDLSFPFKRYQIQPVWRADRPQKGRYQEFYQCDVDVVGSDSLMYEAELVMIYDEVFADLGVHTEIRINNRKVLYGIAEVAGIEDKFMDMTIALDKLDKIGHDGVRKEMEGKGIGTEAIDTVFSIIEEKELSRMAAIFAETKVGKVGVEELEEVYTYLGDVELSQKLSWDITLARGLNYYTGCIYEVVVDTDKHPGIKMGSIGGGGRYADLTGVFGLKDMSGVGVSFGAERIYDVMEDLGLWPEDSAAGLDVLIVAMDKESHLHAFNVMKTLRSKDIIVDTYPDPVKMKKQMKYANDRQVPYVIVIGEEERESELYALKNMGTGEQEKLGIEAIVEKLS